MTTTITDAEVEAADTAFNSLAREYLERGNRIASLELQLAEAREVIRPFANIGHGWPNELGEFVICSYVDAQVTMRDLRRAREWLKANGGGK